MQYGQVDLSNAENAFMAPSAQARRDYMNGSRNQSQNPHGMEGQAAAQRSAAGESRGAVDLSQNPFLQHGVQGSANQGQGSRPPQAQGAQGAQQPAAKAGPKILEVVMRKAEGLPPPHKDTALSRFEGNLEKMVTGTHRAGTAQGATKKSVFPVCTCELKGNPRTRFQTEPAFNKSITNPVWTTEPWHLEDWQSSDVLIFAIKMGDQVVAMKELPYSSYKNGYEWWISLDVADMKRFPDGWPYAAVQVKIQFIDGVKLTQADPWMTELDEKKRGCCDDCKTSCSSCFTGCSMWCSRRCLVCACCCVTNFKWLCKMCCLTCLLCCFECCGVCKMAWSCCLGKQNMRELRRDCAKRFKLPDADEDEEEMDTACCCVPLRTAVFVISVISTVNAMQSFFFPGFLMGESTRFCGGYAVASKVVVGGAQLTGLFFGPVGAFGALELSVSLLNMYNYYQIIRMFGTFFMIYTDVPLLADCNVWRTDINAAIAKHGWNPAMYNVAMGNSCLQSQIDFLLGTAFHVAMYLYLISLTRRLIWDTEQTPKYLLAMPRELPNGAFVKHSRTQGRAKPPYGAILGTDEESLMLKGRLERAAPGQPHMPPGQKRSQLQQHVDKPYEPGPLPPHMMPDQAGGRAPRGVWHPNAMPLPPGHRVVDPRMMGMPGMMPGMPGMMPGMPMGPPGFQY